MTTWKLGWKLFLQCCRQRIGYRINMLLHHLPRFCLVTIIFLVQLVDEFNMVSPVSSEQTSHSVLRKIAIDPIEECGDLVGIRSIVGQGGILPAFISGNGGLGISFDRAILLD